MPEPSPKPKWAVERDRDKARQRARQAREGGTDRVWLFGLHAVRDALVNPARHRHRLVVTRNAADKLADAIASAGIEPEIVDPRKFAAPLDPGSVHQGAALEATALDWGDLSARLRVTEACPAPLVLALDRVTDPHNVGACLRSAEVFGARAVIAPRHYAAPETGALAKAASGALERQPYHRVRNLADALGQVAEQGYAVFGLDGAAETTLEAALAARGRGAAVGPVCLVLGAEGPGLRPRTRETCHALVRIAPAGDFGSLNVSNAAAVALYAAARAGTGSGPGKPEGPP